MSERLDADAAIELGVTVLIAAAPLALLAIPLGIWGHPSQLLALAAGDIALVVGAVVSVVGLLVLGRLVNAAPFRRLNADDVMLLGGSAGAGLLAAGFGGFVAAWVHVAVRDLPTAAAAVVYVLGLVATYVGFALLGTVYRGELHKLAALPASLLGYLVFAVWAGGATIVFGRVLAAFGAS